MRDKIAEGILFAYYGGLLNKHQQEIMRLYCECDLSLAEISEETGLTRQGVRDVIVRSTEKLRECEQKLGLVVKIKRIVSSLEEIIADCDFDDNNKEKVEQLLQDIKEL